jgi:hypothetical protein
MPDQSSPNPIDVLRARSKIEIPGAPVVNVPIPAPRDSAAVNPGRPDTGQLIGPGGTTPTTWVRCGNCKKQYEVPREQPFRYFVVQQHKLSCPAGGKEEVEAQHARLVAEFEQQQTQRRPPRRWWQFWRRNG